MTENKAAAETNEFSNAEVKAKYKPAEGFNWNRMIHVPGIRRCHVRDVTVEMVEAMIKQGRKDFIPVEPAKPGKEQAETKTK